MKRARLPMAREADAICRWCQSAFEPRTSGGRRQHFCSLVHRRAFERALRTWARAEFEAGRVTVGTLGVKKAPVATRALTGGTR